MRSGPERAEAAPVDRQAYVVLAVVTLSSFFVPLMSAAANIALPQIARELGIDAPLLSWVNTSYMLPAAALLLPLGRVADLRGRRSLFVFGTLGFALVTAAVAFARSQGLLLALRLIQGAAGAVPLATSLPLLIAIWPAATRGRAVGVNVAGVYTGLAVGPVLGGILTQAFGWRSIFLLTAALALAVGLVAALYLPPDRREQSAQRLDLPGSALSALGLCAMMVGLSRLPRPDGIGLLASSAAALAGFAFWELRVKDPLFDVRLFAGNRVFLFSNLAALVNYSATAGVGFLLSLYLQRVKGLQPRDAGLVLVVQPAFMALLSTSAGKLSERVEPERLATAGMALAAAGLFLLAAIGASTPIWVVLLALALLGIAFAMFSSPNTNAVMSSVEKHQLGVASATLGTMRGVGQVLSLGICGLLFALMVGSVPMHEVRVEQLVRVLRTAFGAFGVLCLAGVVARGGRGKVHGGRGRRSAQHQ
jgi:EmrB/QacA subfamily drug resistance transporter